MMLDTLSGYIPKQCVCQTLTDLVGGNMACLMPSISLEFSMNSVNNRNFGSMSRHAMFRYKPDSIMAPIRFLSASGLVDLVQNIACLLQSTRSRSFISFVDKRSSVQYRDMPCLSILYERLAVSLRGILKTITDTQVPGGTPGCSPADLSRGGWVRFKAE